MNAKESLLLRKYSTNIVKDLVDDFGIVCLETPMAISAEVKDLTTTDFTGEHGESVYFPSSLYLKAFDWKVKMGTLGKTPSEVVTKINTFASYLMGGDGLGTRLEIASAYTGVGRGGIYLKSCSDVDFTSDSDGNSVAEFEVTFRITDPITLVTISTTTTE